jgi:hypothetical protein
LEERRDADQRDDFVDHQVLLDRRVQWDAVSTDDLDHPGRLVAGAWADQSALAGLDEDRSDDHPMEADHDSPLVKVLDFQREEGHDFRWAEDAGVECRGEAKWLRPQVVLRRLVLADQRLVGRGAVGRTVAGPELADAEVLYFLEYFVELDARVAPAGQKLQVFVQLEAEQSWLPQALPVSGRPEQQREPKVWGLEQASVQPALRPAGEHSVLEWLAPQLERLAWELPKLEWVKPRRQQSEQAPELQRPMAERQERRLAERQAANGQHVQRRLLLACRRRQQLQQQRRHRLDPEWCGELSPLRPPESN